jgi:anthranilate phosphoribosyltransferase
VWDVRKGIVKRYLFDPRSVGFEYASTQDLKGGDAATNASILKAVLSGAKGPGRQATLLNAAFAIVAGGKAEDIREGIEKAARSIDSGAAMSRLEAFLGVLGRKGA